MHQIVRIVTTLWLLLQLAAAVPTPTLALERIPRYAWDTETAKRNAEADAAVGLSENEKLMWASHNEPGKRAVVVSMVAFARQDERILDMDKFSFALESASCNEDDMSLKFKHVLIYYAAKIAWEWVNYNDLRSFVLIPSWEGCGDDKSNDPWVVRGVEFDDKNQQVNLDASKSTWKRVMNSFTLDFGEIVMGGGNDRRDTTSELEKRVDIIPDLNERFRMSVEATLPTKIFEWKKQLGPVNTTLTANCNDCGTQGALVFAGHVEGHTDFDFPNPIPDIIIDRFDLSVTPDGVAANVDLSLEFVGELDYTGLTKPSEEFTLLEIPISGWNIPNILELGPRIQLNAGYEIGYIGGSASASAGVTARIPDSSIAKLDLLSEDSVEISGWVPEIETRPLEVQAQVDAEASIYTEIALSVSFTVLEDTGFGVDLALKVPEVTVTVSGGYDPDGFCDHTPDRWGVSFDAVVGAELDLEGWTELDGDRKELFDITIFEADDLYTFPGFCLNLDGISEGFCDPTAWERPEDEEDDALPENRKRTSELSTSEYNELVRRQEESKRVVYPDCSPKLPPGTTGDRTDGITVLKYPTPTQLKNQKNEKVPVVLPLVGCPHTERDTCEIKYWEVDVSYGDKGLAHVSEKKRRWDSEHVYEGNWIAKYMDHLQKLYTDSETPCHEGVTQFWSVEPVEFPNKPPKSKDPGSYMEALLQQLGTIYTKDKTMALLPNTTNTLKNRMFEGSELFSHFKLENGPKPRKKKDSTEDPGPGPDNDHVRRSCDLGRIVTACKYFDHDGIRPKLKHTVERIEAVLGAMDAHPGDVIKKPAVENFSFVDEHAKFFKKLHEDAIDHTRVKMIEYAKWMVDNDDDEWDELNDKTQKAIEAIAEASETDDDFWEPYCNIRDRADW